MKKFLIFCLLLCMLTGCKQEVEQPVAVPEEPVVEEPVVVPEPEPEPAPEPVLAMAPGDAVTVNGVGLKGGVVMEDTLFVCLRDVTDALGVELKWVAPTAAFTWQGKTVAILEGERMFRVDGQPRIFSAEPVTSMQELLVPVRELAQALNLGMFRDEEQDHLYFTSETGHWEIPEGYYVPTLMYHAVSDDLWGFHELFVSPDDMEAQLKYLQENGYTTIHFSDLARIDEIEKPVLLTFDDGYLDNYTELFPLLQKYQAKATIFVITKSIDTHHLYLTTEQIREMVESGLVEVQSHTVSHPNLDELSREEQEYELAQSKLDVLRMTGREPYVLCYPTGKYNQDTLDLIGDYYSIGLKMNGNHYYTGQSPFEINRWYVSRYTDIWSFADMLDG